MSKPIWANRSEMRAERSAASQARRWTPVGFAIGMSSAFGLFLARLVPQKEILDWHLDQDYARLMFHGFDPRAVEVVPRTAGGLLLQLPLGFVPSQAMYLFAEGVTVAAVVACGWFAFRLADWDVRWLPLATAVLMVSAPARVSIGVGNAGSLVALLVVIAWSRRSGLFAGIAVVLRLWPAVILLPLRSRWKTAAATVVGLEGVGMVLVSEGWDQIFGMGDLMLGHWGNGSLSATVGGPWWTWSPLLLLAFLPVSFDRQMAIAIATGLLVVPISWSGYQLALIPVIGLLRPWQWLPCIFWFSGFGVLGIGQACTVTAIGVLVALLFESFRTGRTQHVARDRNASPAPWRRGSGR